MGQLACSWAQTLQVVVVLRFPDHSFLQAGQSCVTTFLAVVCPFGLSGQLP